jgi:hypothetical protein
MQWGSGMNWDSFYKPPSFSVKKKKEKKKDKELQNKTIRIAVFFDGTSNNRTNVDLGVENAPEKAKKGIRGLSYTREYTNIAKLDNCWKQYNSKDYSDHVYIEGIGTEDEQPDDIQGLALGTGDTGVEGKAEKGLNEVLFRVTNRIDFEKEKIEYLHLDVFGFSRGAAAARNFIYRALENTGLTLKDKLKERGFRINNPPEVKFTGLFDTVASFGLFHFNDTSQLKLDSIKKSEYTLQLAAADEHRKKFRRTNIDSVVNSKGCEILLPGTHGDIGGGCNDYENECGKVIMSFEEFETGLTPNQKIVLENERHRLINEGWYREHEIEIVYNEPFYTIGNRESSEVMSGYVIVNKKNIRNAYDLIPLHIMAEFAQEKGKVNVKAIALKQYSIPEELNNLKQAKKEIDLCCPKPGANGIHSISEKLKIETLKILRHDYLHFSAQYKMPDYPQFSKGGAEYGKRERVIQDG